MKSAGNIVHAFLQYEASGTFRGAVDFLMFVTESPEKDILQILGTYGIHDFQDFIRVEELEEFINK